MNPGVPVEVDVDEMPGYVYPPNIVWEDSLSEVSLNQETKKLNLTPNLQGGTVTITYTEDLTDENYWAKVEFYNGQNGFFNGSTAPKFVKKSGDNTPVSYTHLDVYKRQAYAWIGPRGGTGENPSGNSYRFDLCGLQAGQTGYSTSGIKTSYSWQGYATYIQVDNGTKYKANGNANGSVERCV